MRNEKREKREGGLGRGGVIDNHDPGPPPVSLEATMAAVEMERLWEEQPIICDIFHTRLW